MTEHGGIAHAVPRGRRGRRSPASDPDGRRRVGQPQERGNLVLLGSGNEPLLDTYVVHATPSSSRAEPDQQSVRAAERDMLDPFQWLALLPAAGRERPWGLGGHCSPPQAAILHKCTVQFRKYATLLTSAARSPHLTTACCAPSHP